MKKIVHWLNESIYIPPLSPGCEMCAKGSKMVILITGLCPTSCFYCPLSHGKIGKDRVFADEWELNDENDTEKLILEAKYIKATGASLTGGDPLTVWKRSKKYVELLKDTFGSNFHIHMYTSGIQNYERIPEIVNSGLDEIRFHPLPSHWRNMSNSSIVAPIKTALKTNVDVAIEIPLIPGMENDITTMIKWADKIGVKWVNLNELEFSETNAEKLNNKGYTVKDDISAAVKGSQETGYKIIETIANDDLEIGVHYCPSSFKDGVQLRNRIKRRAKNIATSLDIITKDGTLLKGIITSNTLSLQEIYKVLTSEFKIKNKHIIINKDKNRVEVALWILKKTASSLREKNLECYMIEEYPTADALEIERTPLPF
ncbi:MAG: radical SAM protein [Thermoplasmata archaeon]|nr:MAG: radical SAM protein [Thermoplasmata archaeon]